MVVLCGLPCMYGQKELEMQFFSHRISLGQVMHVFSFRKGRCEISDSLLCGFLMDQEMVQWWLLSGLHQYFMFTENHFTELSPDILAFMYSSLDFICCICM